MSRKRYPLWVYLVFIPFGLFCVAKDAVAVRLWRKS